MDEGIELRAQFYGLGGDSGAYEERSVCCIDGNNLDDAYLCGPSQPTLMAAAGA